MPKIILTFSDMEWKALEWDIYDIQKHFQSFASEKARHTMETLIKQRTNLNPENLAKTDKEVHIHGMSLETAKDRTIRIESEMMEVEA